MMWVLAKLVLQDNNDRCTINMMFIGGFGRRFSITRIVIIKKLIAFLLTVTVPSAWGGIYIYGTRVIYPEQKKEITVQL
ncbi:hypothetical protein NO371_19585, partial [Escherichia coli]|nr:hypothetical protein [Escherichia coli]